MSKIERNPIIKKGILYDPALQLSYNVYHYGGFLEQKLTFLIMVAKKKYQFDLLIFIGQLRHNCSGSVIGGGGGDIASTDRM